MTRTSPPQVSFVSGEIDPLLHRRFDYQRFQTGLSVCQGFLPLAQGGFTRAPGTLHRGSTLANGEGILLPFTFAVNDAVVLEFTNLKMRVWRYGQLVLNAGVPYELTTPYTTASLSRLQWVQSADVIYMADGLRPIQKLSRLALDNWTITAFDPPSGPFRVQNLTKTLTVQASAETGTVSLIASGPLFEANHVGSLMELRPTDFTAIPLFITNEAVVGNLRRTGRNVYQLTATAGIPRTTPPVHTEGEQTYENGNKWLFINDGVGVVRITAVVNSTTATATVLRRLPQDVVANPTYRWSEGAWSQRYGYPASIEIFDQRLCAAATPSEPRTIWFSTAGDFEDFAPGVEADSSFAYAIAGDNTVNRILNLRRAATGLHIFALGEEYSTRSDSRSQIIGPTTTVFTMTSAFGSHTARPIAPNGNPMFISRDRRRLIMVSYSLEADANRPVILSRASQHLGNKGFEQVVWQSSPEPMAWLRRTSGDLAVMIFDAAEEVLGWATVSLAGGICENLAVTPNADGTADEVMAIVRRTVNGSTVRFVETMTPIFGLLAGQEPITAACHFFAAAKVTSGVPITTLSVPHLANETVHVWSDAGEFGPLPVAADGTVALPSAVTSAFAGLFDDSHYAETLDVQAAAADGNTMGRKKRLHAQFGVGLHNTAQGFIQVVERDFAQAPRLGDKRRLVSQAVAATLGETAWSGVAQVPEPSGHASELAVRFYPAGGAPMTVTAVVPIVQEAGR